jgi:arsenite methyltransferase
MTTEASRLKSCCATAYESDFARLLLGNSFHPGGLALTERLGQLLRLTPADHVLDVAAGKGESAAHLAKTFGCRVTAIDLNASEAVLRGDAEHLDFPDTGFDALICECAFCTFPDKPAAASEFHRVLRPGGRLGISDLTRNGPLPQELEGLLAWIACIADARPVSEYAAYLESAGFVPPAIEPHNDALRQMVRDIEGRLLGAELMTKLKKLDLPGADFDQAKSLARAASSAVRCGLLGYALIIAEKAAEKPPCA